MRSISNMARCDTFKYTYQIQLALYLVHWNLLCAVLSYHYIFTNTHLFLITCRKIHGLELFVRGKSIEQLRAKDIHIQKENNRQILKYDNTYRNIPYHR